MYTPDLSCRVYDEDHRELFRAGSAGWAYLRLVEKGLLSGGNINRKYTLVVEEFGVLTVDKDTTMEEINKYSFNRSGPW